MQGRSADECSVPDVGKALRQARAKKERAEDVLAGEAFRLAGFSHLLADREVLVGHIGLSAARLQDPDYREEARMVGRERLSGLTVAKPAPSAESLQMLLEEEPGPDLARCLSRDRFVRVTVDPEARPILVAGRGLYDEYRVLMERTDRILRGPVPGNRLHGLPLSDGGPSAMPTDREVPSPDAPSDTPGLLPQAAGGASEPVHPKTRPYKAAEITPPAGDLHLHQATSETLRKLCAAVVRAEGPVDAETIVARIRQGYGTSRVEATTRSKIADALRALTEQDPAGLILLQGRFYQASAATVNPRDRTGCDAGVRALKNLSDVEISAAVLEALDGAPLCRLSSGETREFPRAELNSAAARLLGYDLRVLGPRSTVAARIDAQIARLIEDGQVAARDGFLARHPASPAERPGLENPAREDLARKDLTRDERATDEAIQGPDLRKIEPPGRGAGDAVKRIAANDERPEGGKDGPGPLAGGTPDAPEAA